jgi:hypothetical protein
MSREEAQRTLLDLGFSRYDVPDILTRIRETISAHASGLTGTHHVEVNYNRGRYTITTSPLTGCTCGYCQMQHGARKARGQLARSGTALVMSCAPFSDEFYAACPLLVGGCGYLSEFVDSEAAAERLMLAHAIDHRADGCE